MRMVESPPDPDSSFAEVPPAVVGARTVGVDLDESVVVDHEPVVVESRRFGDDVDVVGLDSLGC